MNIKLFYRPNESDLETDRLIEKHLLGQERVEMFLRSIEAMLHFLKAFSLDVKELDIDGFRKRLEDLNRRFASDEKPKRTELHFEHQKDKILHFIEAQHKYIADRENELRDIIDLLTKAMANLDIENRDFYHRVYDQSEKMENITRLDDIKRIKTALKHEVSQMRQIVDQKKTQDRQKVQKLASQVDTLRQELEKTRTRSMTDSLTSVSNRQAFDDTLADLIERSRVMNTSFSLMMLDIDDFKQINDTHGHLIGDRVLVAFCQKCRQFIRGDDFIGRYGGEEFVIILPGAGWRDALKKGRQICDGIASTRYATCSDQKDDYLGMTVSIGVTAVRKNDTAEDVIERADKALYKAKRAGKNRAVAIH